MGAREEMDGRMEERIDKKIERKRKESPNSSSAFTLFYYLLSPFSIELRQSRIEKKK